MSERIKSSFLPQDDHFVKDDKNKDLKLILNGSTILLKAAGKENTPLFGGLILAHWLCEVPVSPWLQLLDEMDKGK